MRNKRIIFIHNSTGSRLYRIIPQAQYMAMQEGWDVKIRGLKGQKTGGIEQQLLEWADIVVTEMVYSPDFVKAAKKTGAKFVYELDDLMDKVNKLHYAYKDINWWRRYLTYKCLHMADAITCTVKPLAEHYKWFNQNIHILPNYMDLKYWDQPYLPNDSDVIRIGWIGSNSHKEDLMFIAPVIEKVLKKYPNVKFICTGYGGTGSLDRWTEYNYGENIFKNLSPTQYEFSLGAPYEVFASKIPAMRLDIAIAPVVKNVFSVCKSECKFGEYSVNNIPGVYSKFLYQSVREGITGFTAGENEQEWVNKISTLVESAKLRKEIAGNANRWVRANWDFADHGHKWSKLYNSLLK